MTAAAYMGTVAVAVILIFTGLAIIWNEVRRVRNRRKRAQDRIAKLRAIGDEYRRRQVVERQERALRTADYVAGLSEKEQRRVTRLADSLGFRDDEFREMDVAS